MSESTTEATEAMIDPVTGEIIDHKELAEKLLAQAKEQGVSLVGPGGLLLSAHDSHSSRPCQTGALPLV